MLVMPLAPLVTGNHEALARLIGIADALLDMVP